MTKTILVLNIGSSTIKFALFSIINDEPQEIYTGIVDKILAAPLLKIKNKTSSVIYEKKINLPNQTSIDHYELAINEVLCWTEKNNIEIVAAGHRVVHGALKYREPIAIDTEKLKFLASLNHLAPLHQPYNLKGITLLCHQYPHILQVACFDTAFHTTCNKLSQLYAIPKWLTEKGVQRYGFHGLSYEYIVTQFDKYLPKDKVNGKIIVAHLGQGASMCAIKNKKSVATTLSFTALDGLPMGTRCGNIDPGVLLHLMKHYKMTYAQIEELLYKKSGLLGVSEISSDMRVLLSSDSPDAKLAVDLFIYKTSAWIGMLAAELKGLDGLIFTAGIGENAMYIREKICAAATWLGAKIDQQKNSANNSTISSSNSKISIHVIHTDEELMIAQHTFLLYKKYGLQNPGN